MKTRQFTEDQIIKLLQDGKKGEKPVEDLCRDFGCSTASYYAWKKKYGDTNADEAKRPSSTGEGKRPPAADCRPAASGD